MPELNKRLREWIATLNWRYLGGSRRHTRRKHRDGVVSSWEYAVQCVDKVLAEDEFGEDRDAAFRWAEWADNKFHPEDCGPHRVVRRQVGDWEPVEDTEA